MTLSQTSICNMALADAGLRTTITAITENVPAARTCNLYYNPIMESLLASGQWQFCRSAVTLAWTKALPGTDENTDDAASSWQSTYPQPPWTYEFAYPSDCVKLWFVVPQGQYADLLTRVNAPGLWPLWRQVSVPFEIGSAESGKTILANAQNPVAIYSKRVSNPALWPPDFVQAMVASLAAKLAIPLGGDKQLMIANAQLAQNRLTEAQAIDGNEGITIIDYTPDVLLARDETTYLAPLLGLYR